MGKILMMEGNTIEKQKSAAKLGLKTATQIYIRAIRHWDPEVEIDVINAADGELLPQGASYDDYDGMVISGSGLRAFENVPEVTGQIEALRRFAQTGKPILGSCWGMQIAAVAAGGEVGPSDNGRELGVARKIQLTLAGESHPFFAGKPHVFEAPCIHYDEVRRLPEGSTLLCSNGHSEVQGAIIPVGNSSVWGVQYHPEFELSDIRHLYTFYKQDMLNQGFVNNDEEYQQLMDKLKQLEADPDNKALAWQLGIDSDVLNENIRAIEISNWLNHTIG